MSNTKVFIEILAPIFIAILVLAGLAALLTWQLSPVVLGLAGLGAGGLLIVTLSGLLADGWTHRQAQQQLHEQPKNR